MNAQRCPDWTALAAARHGGDDPPGWRQALAHLDGCERCRPQALAAEPTLLFRRLPTPELRSGDVAAMRQGVAALRRAARLEPSHRDTWAGLGRRLAAGARAHWLRPVAAAALLAVTLLLAPAAPPPGLDHPAAATLAVDLGALDPQLDLGVAPPSVDGGVALPDGGLPERPSIELVGLPDARVYQLADEQLDVVMIVDASLGV